MLCLPVTSSYKGCPASRWRLTVSQDDRGRQDGSRLIGLYVDILHQSKFLRITTLVGAKPNRMEPRSNRTAAQSQKKSTTGYGQFPLDIFPFWAISPPFLSRVSILTRDIDIANRSVCLSARYVPVSGENGLTYRHSFFHHTVAQSF